MASTRKSTRTITISKRKSDQHHDLNVKLYDVKLHVKCYAKASPNNSCPAITNPFETSILQKLDLEQTTVPSLMSTVKSAIESDAFKKKYKEYCIFDRGMVSWREKRGKGNPKTTLNKSVCIEVNDDKKWKAHVKRFGMEMKSGRYLIDVGVILTKEQVPARKRGRPTTTAGSGQTAQKSKKVKTSPFRAPNKLMVNLMGPVFLNLETAVKEVATKAVIDSFEINFMDFVFVRADQRSTGSTSDGSSSCDSNATAPPTSDEDDELMRHTVAQLRNHVGSQIMQSKVYKTVYHGRVGKKVSTRTS